MKSVYLHLTERSAPSSKKDTRVKELHELVTKWGKHNEVKALLEVGVYVDAEDEDGYTPLYNAVKHNADSYKTIQALLKAGADVYYYSDKNYVDIYLENETDIESIEVILDNFTESGFKKEDMDKAIENASIEVKYHYNRMEYAEELLASNFNKDVAEIVSKKSSGVVVKFDIDYVFDNMWKDHKDSFIGVNTFRKVALAEDPLDLLDKNDQKQYNGQFFAAYERLSSDLIDMAYKYAKQQGYEGEYPEGEPDTDLGRFLLKDDIAETMIDTYTEHEYDNTLKILDDVLREEECFLKGSYIYYNTTWSGFSLLGYVGGTPSFYYAVSEEEAGEFIEDYHNDMEEVFQKAIKD